MTTPETADVYSDEGYYAVIPEWVLDADISALAVRLYGVLRRYADQRTMHAHPSRKTLADRLKVKSIRTVDAAITELKELGALSTFPRFTAAGDPDSNGYRLHRRPQIVSPAGVNTTAGGGAADCTTPSSELHDGGAADCTTVVQPAAPEPQPLIHSQKNHTSLPSGERAPAREDQLSLVDAPAEPAEKPGRRRTQLPEGWEPSPELAAWTREFAPGFPRSELDQFRDWAKENRVLKADWDATWRNSVRRWKERTSRTRGPGRPGPYRDTGWQDGTSAASWDRLKQTGGQDR